MTKTRRMPRPIPTASGRPQSRAWPHRPVLVVCQVLVRRPLLLRRRPRDSLRPPSARPIGTDPQGWEPSNHPHQHHWPHQLPDHITIYSPLLIYHLRTNILIINFWCSNTINKCITIYTTDHRSGRTQGTQRTPWVYPSWRATIVARHPPELAIPTALFLAGLQQKREHYCPWWLDSIPSTSRQKFQMISKVCSFSCMCQRLIMTRSSPRAAPYLYVCAIELQSVIYKKNVLFKKNPRPPPKTIVEKVPNQ